MTAQGAGDRAECTALVIASRKGRAPEMSADQRPATGSARDPMLSREHPKRSVARVQRVSHPDAAHELAKTLRQTVFVARKGLSYHGHARRPRDRPRERALSIHAAVRTAGHFTRCRA